MVEEKKSPRHVISRGGKRKEEEELINELLDELARFEEENEALRRELLMLSQRKNSDLDSIELGAASKGGKIKVYFDSTRDADTMKEQVDVAVELLSYAKKSMEEKREVGGG